MESRYASRSFFPFPLSFGLLFAYLCDWTSERLLEKREIVGIKKTSPFIWIEGNGGTSPKNGRNFWSWGPARTKTIPPVFPYSYPKIAFWFFLFYYGMNNRRSSMNDLIFEAEHLSGGGEREWLQYSPPPLLVRSAEFNIDNEGRLWFRCSCILME